MTGINVTLAQLSKRILRYVLCRDSDSYLHNQLFRMYFLGDVVRPLGVTCRGKTDGAGAQIQATLSVIAFCRRTGLPYCHSPLKSVEHTKTDDEILRWENLLSLSAFSSMEPGEMKSRRIVSLAEFKSLSRKEKKGSIVAVEHAHAFTECHSSSFVALAAKLRQVPRTNETRPDGHVGISVHVRRGDVSPSRNFDRFTSNADLVNWIAAVSELALSAGLVPDITVFSQGEPDEFSDIAKATQCKLRLNVDPVDTLKEMASSDVLLMSKSSFGFLAALLCDGVVVYEPFWHGPLPHWVRIENGEIQDRNLLLSRLKKLHSGDGIDAASP